MLLSSQSKQTKGEEIGCNCRSADEGYEEYAEAFSDTKPLKEDMIADDGVYNDLLLHSFTKSSDEFELQLTIRSIEIKDGTFYSKFIVSGPLTGNKFDFEGTSSLSLSSDVNGLAPLVVRNASVNISEEESEVVSETDKGLLVETVSGPIFTVSLDSSIRGESVRLSTPYFVPREILKSCFYIETKCFWKKCGPRWARYRCHFQCRSRACSCGSTPHVCGSWGKVPTTLSCSALYPHCNS